MCLQRLDLDIDGQSASGIFQMCRDGAEFDRPQLDAERLGGERVGGCSGSQGGCGAGGVTGKRAPLLERAGEGCGAARRRNHLCGRQRGGSGIAFGAGRQLRGILRRIVRLAIAAISLSIRIGVGTAGTLTSGGLQDLRRRVGFCTRCGWSCVACPERRIGVL